MLKRILCLLVFSSLVVSTANAQPSTGQALNNLMAFVHLVGYVRYFYPGDVASGTDWDAFTASHIESVETAASPSELAQRLTDLFSPYAPLLQIFPSGTPPAVPDDLKAPPDDAKYITMWIHIPLGSGISAGIQMWPGDRLKAPLGSKTVPFSGNNQVGLLNPPFMVTVLDPSQPYRADLGAGVSALIPLALYGDDSGTLPHTPKPAADNAQGSHQAVYMAAVAKIWNVLQHFYAYWDVNKIDWQAALRDALSGMTAATSDDDALVTLKRLLALLQDGHNFTTRSDQPELGNYTLPFTWDVVENQLVVTTALSPDSPLKPGDIITAINGEPSANAIQDHLALLSQSGGYGLFTALLELMSGDKGKTLKLDVTPASGAAPSTVDAPYSFSGGAKMAYFAREKRPPVLAKLGSGIVYLDLTRLSESGLKDAMPVLAQAKGIVFDMRGYPFSMAPIQLLGHLTDQPMKDAPFLLPVITQPDHQNMQFVDVSSVWAQPTTPRLTDNIAWLINANGTVSYAESIMGIVEGYHLGQRVGSPTAGTNGDVVSLLLPGGWNTTFTGLRVTKFDGSPLMHVGIQPTMTVTRTIAGVAAGRDELLESAFTLISGQPATSMSIKAP